MPRCATVSNPFALRPSSENTAFILGCMPVSPGNWVMNVSYVGRVARVFRVIALPKHPAGASLRRCFHREARLALILYVLCPSRRSLECIGHRTRSARIFCGQFGDLKSCRRDQLVHLTIQSAASSNVLPEWRNAILPNCHIGIWGTAVLNKYQVAFRLEHSVHLQQCLQWIRHAA